MSDHLTLDESTTLFEKTCVAELHISNRTEITNALNTLDHTGTAGEYERIYEHAKDAMWGLILVYCADHCGDEILQLLFRADASDMLGDTTSVSDHTSFCRLMVLVTAKILFSEDDNSWN